MEIKTISPGGARVGMEAARRDEVRAASPSRIARQHAPLRDALRNASAARSANSGASERREWIAMHQRINEQASGMQQVLDYLAGFDDRLTALKQAIGTRLVGGGSDLSVRTQLERTAGEWRRRLEAASGRLDATLELGSAGSAKREFTVRGLNARDARRAEGEVITFQLAGTGARPATIYLAPDLSTSEMVFQLKAGLSPIDIACDEDEAGRIRFSVEESRWPLVALGLHVKGTGVRFPDGAPQRPALTDVSGRIDPAGWRMEDREALRASLREVVTAQKSVDQVSDRARQLLQSTRSALASMPAERGADWARAASEQTVAQMGATRSYAGAVALAAAVAGVDRAHVRALLALQG